MEHTISIAPSGAVTSMYTDKFSLAFLGSQRITRASEILWDEEDQAWSIWFGSTVPLPQFTGFDSYETARAFEVEAMNYHFRTGQPLATFTGAAHA